MAARATAAAMAAAACLAACSSGLSLRELEPGVIEVVNGHGRFVFMDRSAWASKGKAGLGFRLAAADGGMEVVEVFQGGPAAAARVLPGDLVTSIDGRPAAGLGLDEAVGLIRGAPGSIVVLGVRSGGNETRRTVRRDPAYKPFADFPEGVALRAVPATVPAAQAAGAGRPAGTAADPHGACLARTSDGCLFLINREATCHYSCR